MPKLRNRFEVDLDNQLRKSKIIYTYETERIAYVRAGHYKPDFILRTKLGKIYIEAKGFFRAEHKSILRAVKKCNPQLDIRLVFYSRNVKYIKWAEKNGFKWAIKHIPQEWLDE